MSGIVLCITCVNGCSSHYVYLEPGIADDNGDVSQYFDVGNYKIHGWANNHRLLNHKSYLAGINVEDHIYGQTNINLNKPFIIVLGIYAKFDSMTWDLNELYLEFPKNIYVESYMKSIVSGGPHIPCPRQWVDSRKEVNVVMISKDKWTCIELRFNIFPPDPKNKFQLHLGKFLSEGVAIEIAPLNFSYFIDEGDIHH